METWMALKLLQDGKKIRRQSWRKGDYIKLNKIGRIFDKNDKPCPIELSKLWDDWIVVIEDKVKCQHCGKEININDAISCM